MYDVLIIGGGVTGSAIARELSRYDLKTALFEKGEDVCSGTSKANSGIAHAGFDAAPGSWKAKMNIRGSRMLEELSRKLDFPYKRNGSLVLCFDEKDRPIWKKKSFLFRDTPANAAMTTAKRNVQIRCGQ